MQRGDTALELGDDLPEAARLTTDFDLSVVPSSTTAAASSGSIVDDVLEQSWPTPGAAAPRLTTAETAGGEGVHREPAIAPGPVGRPEAPW